MRLRYIDADKFQDNRHFPCKSYEDSNIRRAVELGLEGAPTVPAIPIDRIKQLKKEIDAEVCGDDGVNLGLETCNGLIDNMLKEYGE